MGPPVLFYRATNLYCQIKVILMNNNTIVLKEKSIDGEPLEASFLPDKGMNMISFKKGNIEVIDQSTRSLFEERFAGLGALIGPHFHRRKTEILPPIKDESLFPHIARIRAKGIEDPFSHGIARYAPWQAQATQTKVNAVLSGKDKWNEVLLSDLEGQNFKMTYTAELAPNGLHINMSVVSDKDSLVGIHYYYNLPEGKGTIRSRIQNRIIENGEVKKVPSEWSLDEHQMLVLPLDNSIDCTFYPYPNPLEGDILLHAGSYKLRTLYSCASQENCWQLYHPAGASFVCIEPISSQDPRHPNLTVSSISIQLEILSPRLEYV